jgi:hypothetical protein
VTPEIGLTGNWAIGEIDPALVTVPLLVVDTGVVVVVVPVVVVVVVVGEVVVPVVVVVVGRMMVVVEIDEIKGTLKPPTDPSCRSAGFRDFVTPKSAILPGALVLTMPSRRPVDAVEDEENPDDAETRASMRSVVKWDGGSTPRLCFSLWVARANGPAWVCASSLASRCATAAACSFPPATERRTRSSRHEVAPETDGIQRRERRRAVSSNAWCSAVLNLPNMGESPHSGAFKYPPVSTDPRQPWLLLNSFSSDVGILVSG